MGRSRDKLANGDCTGLAALGLNAMAEGSADIVLDQGLDQAGRSAMDLGCLAVLERPEITLDADLAEHVIAAHPTSGGNAPAAPPITML